ncbi:choline/carnitine O-acyltransferase [Pseudonocardia sp.]|uniref:choline/carnitine O-acyltransferase n=1 Tax=Pseudonocardia sp. TaxID=60912 RepID=UPI003D09FA1C
MTAISTRTFGNEDALPRVPLPALEDSCARFLDWCAPLLTADELAATETAVAELLKPDGPARVLHRALEEFDATADSWLDAFWPYRYLGRRDRIALNANFFFLFQPAGLGQVARAAGLIAGALAFKGLVDREELPPETLRGVPLSMEQNRYLFSATRIPGVEIDSARTPYSAEHPGPSHERHVIVFRRGRMFRLDVIGPVGVPHALAEIEAALQRVVDTTEPAQPGTSVGHLTTKARAEWAASRARLAELGDNADLLDVVERALFCVTLEDVSPSSALEACDQLLHGDSANRWFDKATTFVVLADGTAGFNGEHCKLDGTTVVGLIDFLLATTAARHAEQAGARAQGEPRVVELAWTLDGALRGDVTAAGEAFADYAAATATTTLSIDGFTAEDAKALRCSPDAFAQLAFQLAHRRSKGLTGATYESIATRRFRHGRTEAMRVVTPEIVRFVETWDSAATDDARRTAFRAAADAHVARARQCQAGDAPEQHLWELQLVQRRRGEELGATDPIALFDSPGWTVMRDDYLSTSAVPSPNVQFFGFGSTSARCIGIGYALMPTRFDLYLSTPRAVADRMHDFARHLRDAIAELSELLRAEIPG